MTIEALLAIAGALIMLLLGIIAWFYRATAARDRDEQAQMREEIRGLRQSDEALTDRVQALRDDLHTKYVPRAEFDHGINRLERLVGDIKREAVDAVKALSDRIDRFTGKQ